MPTESKSNRYKPAKFDASVNDTIFGDKEYVHSSMSDDSSILINALPKDLHRGQNPRYGRPGRIPNSINIISHTCGIAKVQITDEIMNIFSDHALEKSKTIVNYCGGGISATLDSFLLYQLGSMI